MEAYIYQADIWCESCGEQIRRELIRTGKAPSDPQDESSYDSDDFPKGPYPDGGGEADMPQHCGSGGTCLLAEVDNGRTYGAFLENPLTEDGRAYVLKALRDHYTKGGSPLASMWAAYYDIELPEEDNEEAQDG